MKYISLFSGIEAATVAWEPLGWEPVAFCEIEKFPSAVLSYRFPNVPNLGDITKVDWSEYRGTIDVIVGGSPCQSFSMAGGREGLSGKSGLMFEYIRAVREIMPRYFVWENVCGALSCEGGFAFKQLLSQMDALGYGLAWRVLDAQFFGLAQKRERVFLVGSLGDMSCAEALFESESMCWDSMESKEQRNRIRQAAGSGAAQNIIVIDRAAYNQGINAKYIPHIERCDLMDTIVAKGPNAVAVFKQDSCEIRRLTPKEEERLNGFPDDWTLVPYKGKLASDNVRYKAIGNSMAVPVMHWIGKRIQKLY